MEECVVGLLSLVLAAGTIHLTSDGRDIAAVWPANAVLLAALLDRRPGARAGVFVAGFVANLAANAIMRGRAPAICSMPPATSSKSASRPTCSGPPWPMTGC
ncbi:hypothetical protein [Methylobacterium aquaticum]|uniref:hypothetical protein n=1 Tax=Methylobacterium aquaticum TaxID=270351 RepID=UPI001FED5FAA|nr:hypothetical protein [Methylobacterium aquaticum]